LRGKNGGEGQKREGAEMSDQGHKKHQSENGGLFQPADMNTTPSDSTSLGDESPILPPREKRPKSNSHPRQKNQEAMENKETKGHNP